MLRFSINDIEFSSGDKIDLEDNSLLLLIGPNSAGKSTALTDIENLLQNPYNRNLKVIRQLNYNKEGDHNDFKNWLEEHFPSGEINGSVRYYTKGQTLNETQLENQWNNISNIFHFLFHRLNTEERLQIVKTKNSTQVFQNNPSEYIHVLQSDSNLLKKVSDEVREAFKKDLIINWGGGANVWFHVGDEPKMENGADRVSSEYLRELNKLEKLEQEGDGIKSFVGCLLGILCGAQKLLLVDEPEAFLHPPQARKLGSILANSATDTNRQIIVATHSADIIKGAIDSGHKVSVCRIEKTEEKTNNAFLLKSEQLKELWSKPMLQSTSAINGIFHSGVIVCEADSDCRFFESILNRIENKQLLSKPSDFYFIHGGGKGEIATLVNSYKTLNVRTAAIADFDLLRNQNELKKIINNLGGNWDDFETNYNSSKSALDDLPRTKTIPQFISEMNTLLEKIGEDDEISNSQKQIISDLLSDSTKWSEAKKYGINKLAGGAYQSCEDLLNQLSELGLFIIQSGELESWWRGGPSSKSEWIVNALEKIKDDPDFAIEAEDFFLSICEYLGVKKK
jgi:predicted ATP-dependent endonuclease of OLD family